MKRLDAMTGHQNQTINTSMLNRTLSLFILMITKLCVYDVFRSINKKGTK